MQEPAPRPSILYQPSKTSSLPFPSRLKKQKKDDEDERLLSIFKQIHINLPFLEAMIHMSKGTKVLKDLLLHKEKLEKATSSVKLSEECSAIIQRSQPQKEETQEASHCHVVPKKGGMTVVKNEKVELIPQRTVTGWRVCIDYHKLNNATRKDHFPLLFIDQMLERLAGHEYYYFWIGFLDTFKSLSLLEIKRKPRSPALMGPSRTNECLRIMQCPSHFSTLHDSNIS
ncbi:hypothetical protein Tco_1093886 [Tanacetum coccineum]|uniref:Reverse transcriptase n=1 Tax=Tanacetum coccineum TaxID=301880 RepID=A0ABQ5IE16_9ASTR